MKQLLFIAFVLALFSCKKKDDPKPADPTPPPKTSGLFTFTFSAPGSDYNVAVNWDSDASFDTSFSKIAGKPPVEFTRRINQNTVSIKASIAGRTPGSPEKINIKITEGAIVNYSGSDTLYNNRVFTLW